MTLIGKRTLLIAFGFMMLSGWLAHLATRHAQLPEMGNVYLMLGLAVVGIIGGRELRKVYVARAVANGNGHGVPDAAVLNGDR